MPESSNKPTLVEIFKKAGISSNLSDVESAAFDQKMGKLDAVSGQVSDLSLTPVGNRWHGTYNFKVDWDSDETFTGTYDDLSSRFISASIRRGLPGAEAFCAIPALIEITVDNNDNRFTADNASSPIYTQLNSTAKKRCKMTVTISSTEYYLCEGWLKEIAAQPSTHGRKMATFVLDDYVGRLKSIPMVCDLNEDFTEVEALEEALGLGHVIYYGYATYGAGLVYGGVSASLATSLDTFDYSGDLWRESETSVLDAVTDIMQSILGYFYVTRAGAIVFRTRQWRPTNAATSDWDCSKITRIDAVGLQDETTYNEVQIVVRQPRELSAETVMWTLRETPTLGPLESKTYTAQFIDPATGAACGLIDPVTPVQGTDYTNNSNLTVTVDWRGPDALVTVENTSSGSITLSLLQLRGTPVVRYDETVLKGGGTVTPRKTKWHPTPCLTNLVNADSYVNWLYILFSYLSNKPKQATITPYSAADLAEVCQIDVDRRIVAKDTDVFFVNWVHHKIDAGSHICTVGLTPAVSQEMWVLGTSELGTTTTLGV